MRMIGWCLQSYENVWQAPAIQLIHALLSLLNYLLCPWSGVGSVIVTTVWASMPVFKMCITPHAT